MEITSSWSPGVDLGLAEEIQGKEIHIFTPQSTNLFRADEEKPCSITIVLPSVVKLLDIDIESSARHVEVYNVSISPTGERQFSYVDTIRGLKGADLYHVAYAFSNDTALQVASGVSFKFVSVQPPQEKDCLKLAKLELRIQASTVVQAPVPEPANPTPARAPIDMDSMKMILAMQQAMQKQMEEKIYQAVDSRLNLLTQRLQSTESMLHKLTTKFSKAEMKQDKDAFASLLKRLASLEKQVGSMKAANGNLTASLEQLAINASDSLSSDVADGRQSPKPTTTTTTDITAASEASFAPTTASTNPSPSMDQRVASLDSALTASISERDTTVSQDLDPST
ncbi:hypothetical protein AC1031_019360 [Aphanomyces cochlioides]|nr:hypothetical protein AC1031_019360 [Aphanomyces cochlioides]